MTAAITHEAFLHEKASTLFDTAEAVFSEDRVYRYRLTRRWGDSGTHAVWLMLNPSTADAMADDPTIRRCISFTKAWDLHGLTVVNLFALRSTDPKALKGHSDPVGPANDRFIREAIHPWSVVVAAWGVHGALNGRGAQVIASLAADGIEPACLGVTKFGHPKHPLYVPAATKLMQYQPQPEEAP
jgi:hypothetical protein